MLAYGVHALLPPNLVLEGAHSTLEFKQDVEDLAKKREQVLETTKLLLTKTKTTTKANPCRKTQIKV
jgi:hypothetical protein